MTQSCSWVNTSSTDWAALIVAFKAGGPGALSVSGATLASTLVVRAPTVAVAASKTITTGTRASTAQLFAPTGGNAVPAGITQVAVEILDVVPASPLAATQLAAEILYANANEARVTELVVELIVVAYAPDSCTADAAFPIDPD
jgi:hypothetical protein